LALLYQKEVILKGLLKIDPKFLLSRVPLNAYRNSVLDRGYHLGGDPVGGLGSDLGGRFGSRFLSWFGGCFRDWLGSDFGDNFGSGFGSWLGSNLGSGLGGSPLSNLGSRFGDWSPFEKMAEFSYRSLRPDK